MEFQEENQYARTSHIKPPTTRLPSPSRGLSEMSDSNGNARTRVPASKMPQPTSALKRFGEMSNNEPEPKRKTLAERAGEPISGIARTPSVSRATVKGTSLTGLKSAINQPRNTSLASSMSSRTPSVTSRHTSSSSFSSSVGAGYRPKSAYGSRPNTAMSQGHTRAKTSITKPRPQRSADSTVSDDDILPPGGKRKAFDVHSRMDDMEAMYDELKSSLAGSQFERSSLEEAVTLYKARLNDLESIRSDLAISNKTLQNDLDETKQKLNSMQEKLYAATTSLDDNLRAHRIEVDDISRSHRSEVDKIRRDNTEEIDRLLRVHRDELREAERKVGIELDERVRDLERRNDSKLEEERTRRLREVHELESQIATGHHSLKVALQMKDQEIQILKQELEDVKSRLEREQEQKETAQKSAEDLRQTLQKTGAENTSTIGSLESTIASLRAHISFLESGSKAQSDSFVEMEGRLQEALAQREISQQKLIKEETLRRILFNQVQELKGNIRVMCRVRPAFKEGAEGACANITYPDTDKESKELTIIGKEKKSSFGTVTRETHSFSFDRVFGPSSQNQEVFEEISQLVQSALDGYNVCIFCYGQTGAGKTHTMSSADGMIPRATHQIYETATSLKEKGWTYTMEGSFVEVYNEEIHDLLGSSKDFEKKKHEIRHDDVKKQTTITGLKKVELDSPNAVEAILKQADNNRSMAATKSNERSSRSHSVFILKLVGRNSTTNETSEGTLNLVDLAGSERLKVSGAEGERMKETQNINKSLSCLGDVIGALGQGKEGTHIPYRNSKLTYLLQYSLGGNSKTLMFVMASPLEAHLHETLTSLKFATKVHNTHIGTAKKSTKVHGQ
ncbi:kinesin-like nuclear fusion protein [Clarireedia jacksonii]